MENCLLNSALEYAKRGWYIFPCREKDSELFLDSKTGKERIMIAKSPYVKGGFHSATIDEAQISDWWRTFPNAAIGISCEPSNMVVIDVDVKGGVNGFDNFMRLNISDAGALHGLTPSGGTHIIYSGLMDSNANTKIGIDIRSRGGYIIAPPSTIETKSGKSSYIMLDDWNRIPVNFPEDLPEKLKLYIAPKANQNKNIGAKFMSTESKEETLKKAKLALDTLPISYCDDYDTWIKVGLSLKSIGEEAFELWDTWSRKSVKYDSTSCVTKWESFSNVKEIGIGSLFFLAKEAR